MWPQCNQNIYSDTIPKINYDSILEWNILSRNSTFKPKQCERKYVCQGHPIANICRREPEHEKINFLLNPEMQFESQWRKFDVRNHCENSEWQNRIHLSFDVFNILRWPFTWAYPVTLYACPVTNPFDNLLLCPCVILVCIKTKF